MDDRDQYLSPDGPTNSRELDLVALVPSPRVGRIEFTEGLVSLGERLQDAGPAEHDPDALPSHQGPLEEVPGVLALGDQSREVFEVDLVTGVAPCVQIGQHPGIVEHGVLAS
jgi:hypothetical protein